MEISLNFLGHKIFLSTIWLPHGLLGPFCAVFTNFDLKVTGSLTARLGPKARPNSLFHMKITAKVTKSSHQDPGLCYSLTSFFLIHTFLFCWNIKSCCHHRDPCSINTSNHMFGRVIWDKFSNIMRVIISLNMWLLSNHTKSANTFHWNWHL